MDGFRIKFGLALNIIFLIVVVTYLLPAGILISIKFFKLVVFGASTWSEFRQHLHTFSFGPVNNFYVSIWAWFANLLVRLRQ